MSKLTKAAAIRYWHSVRRLACSGSWIDVSGTLGLGMLATLACAPSVQAAGASRIVQLQRGSDSPSVSVSIGNTETLRTSNSFVDLVVGDPGIADVMPLTNKSFYVHGKKPGTTTVSAYDGDKLLVGTIEIEVGANSNRLQKEIQSRMPGSRIRVASINGRIELSGSVQDAGQSHFKTGSEVLTGMRHPTLLF